MQQDPPRDALAPATEPPPVPAAGLTPRQIPRWCRPVGRLEVFEPRLALSANPAAELLAETLGAFSGGPFSGGAWNADDAAQVPWEPRGASAAASGSSVWAPLVDQAALVREAYGFSGAGQTVAVIDSGIAWDHVALGQGYGPGYRVVGGWDFAEDDADPYDDGPSGFHGTHVGGLVVGDGGGFTGIAPGADMVGLRVFDDLGRSSLDWIESALQWVYDHKDAFESPITTVNLSLGALLPDALAEEVHSQLEDELRQLADASIVVVAAAGNAFDAAHPDRLNYPASSPNTWAVASTDLSGSLSSFSQREDSILATVGRGVRSSVPDHVLGMDGEVNDFHTANGTSMAAPQIAAASMLVRQAVESQGGTATPEMLLEILRQTAMPQQDPATGLTYLSVDLQAAIASVVDGGGEAEPSPGDDGLEPPATGGAPADGQPLDLGVVQWRDVAAEPGDVFRMTASRSGWFSVGVDQPQSGLAIRIWDASGGLLWDAPVPENGQIDLAVEAGQALRLETGPGGSATLLRLANVIGLHDGHLEIASGPEDPQVQIDLSDGLAAEIGSLRYHFPAGAVTSGVIDGGDGADRLAMRGSEAAGRLTLNPYADGRLVEGGVDLVLRGFEEVTYDGGGGGDRAYLYDTVGDDQLHASPGEARLEGVGFRYEIQGVARSYVHATAGGQDMAFLNDSPGDDVLAVRPQFVSLRGGQFFNSAYGFERVYAFANAGGWDHADLYDSAGDDRLTASATSAMITGNGYYVQARQFDSITGHATAGGEDLATLYTDADSQARWIRTADQVVLRGGESGDRIARGFETVQAFHAGTPVEINTSAAPPVQSLGLAGLAAAEEQRERRVLCDLFAALGQDEEETAL